MFIFRKTCRKAGDLFVFYLYKLLCSFLRYVIPLILACRFVFILYKSLLLFRLYMWIAMLSHLTLGSTLHNASNYKKILRNGTSDGVVMCCQSFQLMLILRKLIPYSIMS